MPDPELLREWHPLDHRLAPEYIPPCWDRPHAGKRLAEALRTLRYMPLKWVSGGFYEYSWPAIVHEYSDRAGYENGAVWKAERTAVPTGRSCGRHRSRSPDGDSDHLARALSGLDSAIPQLLCSVQAVALSRARDRDIAHAARKLRLPARLARRWE